MSKRGKRHMKLISCDIGERDGEFYEHCCLRKEWDAKGWTKGHHRCELYDMEPCPFGVAEMDEEGNVVRL